MLHFMYFIPYAFKEMKQEHFQIHFDHGKLPSLKIDLDENEPCCDAVSKCLKASFRILCYVKLYMCIRK